MSNMLRVDSRMFIRLFVIFNVALAVYNFLSFKLYTKDTVPCTIVIGTSNMSALPARLIGARDYTSSTPAYGIKPSSGLQKRGKYYVLPNYVPANRTYNGNESVTLTTQGSASFLKHSGPLCKRWGGPVSVAVYLNGGGEEVLRALRIIVYYRMCGEACVRENVTWHLVLRADATWPDLGILIDGEASSPTDIIFRKLDSWIPPRWIESTEYNCSAINSTELLQSGPKDEGVRKVGHGYPINVARNVARSLATTFYVLASDIELYPSANVIPRFLKMVSLEANDKKGNAGPHVYVLPIFEVNKDEKVPKNKVTLVKLLDKKKAVYFHKWVCDACQNFPGRDTWVKSFPINDTLGVHAKTKRNRSRGSWEPIYIGTNNDPFYEEGLSWEGKRDKMSQMFEMCMLDYTLYVLDNAFLVHAPGIKVIKGVEEKRRYPFMRDNNIVYERAMQAIRKKYPNRRSNC